MTDYDETNRGAVWGNDKKETDNHPDFKGNLNVEGVEYWVSGWKRKPGDNPKAPSMRFSIQRKEDAHNNGVSQAQKAVNPEGPYDPDGIPF